METAAPTETIVWFPPTSTPTPFPTQETTPTPDQRPGVGDVIFSDDFSTAGSWTLGKTPAGNVALGNKELTIAIHEPGAYDFTDRREPLLRNFYLEITASPTLCRGEDEYGLLLRMSSPEDFIRYSLSCDGRVRVERLIGGTASSPQPWIETGAIPSGAPSTSRLAVWASEDEMRFFSNGEYLFTVTASRLSSGSLGLFARSAGDMAVTVSFSDLTVYQIGSTN